MGHGQLEHKQVPNRGTEPGVRKGTVHVFIFAGEKFHENIGKTFHVGYFFTILLVFPS